MAAEHHVSASCEGEFCTVCRDPATHKLGEEIMHDDPLQNRHNLTAYVCCQCFSRVLGPATGCEVTEATALRWLDLLVERRHDDP